MITEDLCVRLNNTATSTQCHAQMKGCVSVQQAKIRTSINTLQTELEEKTEELRQANSDYANAKDDCPDCNKSKLNQCFHPR